MMKLFLFFESRVQFAKFFLLEGTILDPSLEDSTVGPVILGRHDLLFIGEVEEGLARNEGMLTSSHQGFPVFAQKLNL
jgi:hypothetical protein